MIRPTTYRNKIGFSVTGRDDYGRSFKIFARTREGAKQIFTAAKQGNSEVVDRLLRAGK